MRYQHAPHLIWPFVRRTQTGPTGGVVFGDSGVDTVVAGAGAVSVVVEETVTEVVVGDESPTTDWLEGPQPTQKKSERADNKKTGRIKKTP